jgi:hypothetical protein
MLTSCCINRENIYASCCMLGSFLTLIYREYVYLLPIVYFLAVVCLVPSLLLYIESIYACFLLYTSFLLCSCIYIESGLDKTPRRSILTYLLLYIQRGYVSSFTLLYIHKGYTCFFIILYTLCILTSYYINRKSIYTCCYMLASLLLYIHKRYISLLIYT